MNSILYLMLLLCASLFVGVAVAILSSIVIHGFAILLVNALLHISLTRKSIFNISDEAFKKIRDKHKEAEACIYRNRPTQYIKYFINSYYQIWWRELRHKKSR